jgi:hypothetical protein
MSVALRTESLDGDIPWYPIRAPIEPSFRAIRKIFGIPGDTDTQPTMARTVTNEKSILLPFFRQLT